VALRRLLIGKRLTLPTEGSPVTLTVSTLESRLDVRRLSVGQLDDVRVSMIDIHWRTTHFDNAAAVLHNVHVRPGVPPMLVAAPVHLSLDVSTITLDELLRTVVPRLTGSIGDDGVARVRWARRPRLGHVEVAADLDGAMLLLRPQALTVRRRRWQLPARTPAYRVRLPDLPHGLELTGIHVGTGLLRVGATMPQWRMGFSRRHVENLLDL
jgi:hypothetical protein